MLGEKPVEQHLIAIVHGGEVNVLAECVRQPFVLNVGPVYLRVLRADFRWDQAGVSQGVSFVRRVGGSLIQQRRTEPRQSTSLGLMTFVPVLSALRHGRQYRDDSLSHAVASFV